MLLYKALLPCCCHRRLQLITPVVCATSLTTSSQAIIKKTPRLAEGILRSGLSSGSPRCEESTAANFCSRVAMPPSKWDSLPHGSLLHCCSLLTLWLPLLHETRFSTSWELKGQFSFPLIPGSAPIVPPSIAESRRLHRWPLFFAPAPTRLRKPFCGPGSTKSRFGCAVAGTPMRASRKALAW